MYGYMVLLNTTYYVTMHLQYIRISYAPRLYYYAHCHFVCHNFRQSKFTCCVCVCGWLYLFAAETNSLLKHDNLILFVIIAMFCYMHALCVCVSVSVAKGKCNVSLQIAQNCNNIAMFYCTLCSVCV